MKKSIATLMFHAFLFILVSCLPACVHKRQIDKQKLHINPTTIPLHTTHNNPPPVTIWVHGTFMFRQPLYHKLFHNKSCLLPATAFADNNYFKLLAQTIAKQDPQNFPLEEFYIFGWSGQLQNQKRKESAEKLYEEIVELYKKYQTKYGFTPTIRIIAHSHGGNVVLNMAQLKNTTAQLPIKSLILLACPVQEETMHLISTAMFERVYSLYSSFDMIQILAPQFKRIRIVDSPSMRRKRRYKILPFSARLFPHYEHLTQVKIKINNYPVSHSTFARKEFVILLPTILHKLDAWHDESCLINSYYKYKLLCIHKK